MKDKQLLTAISNASEEVFNLKNKFENNELKQYHLAKDEAVFAKIRKVLDVYKNESSRDDTYKKAIQNIFDITRNNLTSTGGVGFQMNENTLNGILKGKGIDIESQSSQYKHKLVYDVRENNIQSVVTEGDKIVSRRNLSTFQCFVSLLKDAVPPIIRNTIEVKADIDAAVQTITVLEQEGITNRIQLMADATSPDTPKKLRNFLTKIDVDRFFTEEGDIRSMSGAIRASKVFDVSNTQRETDLNSGGVTRTLIGDTEAGYSIIIKEGRVICGTPQNAYSVDLSPETQNFLNIEYGQEPRIRAPKEEPPKQEVSAEAPKFG